MDEDSQRRKDWIRDKYQLMEKLSEEYDADKARIYKKDESTLQIQLDFNDPVRSDNE